MNLVIASGKKSTDISKDISVTTTTIERRIKQYSLHGENAVSSKSKYYKKMDLALPQLVYYP
ncbi:hypothetical protein [Natronincola ferrireducens]|uniref:hypothetical protein n=1 Tax=Natronincola ferrireducens TaxID=393762 RepID=UPI0015A4280F|nr:hypothetical protein [Natronincola ferrireducens]